MIIVILHSLIPWKNDEEKSPTEEKIDWLNCRAIEIQSNSNGKCLSGSKCVCVRVCAAEIHRKYDIMKKRTHSTNITTKND